MMIKYKPYIRLNPLDKTVYEFEGDVVRLKVTHVDENPQEIVYEYDFTGLPDGVIDTSDEFLWSAEKVEGVIRLELFYYVGMESKEVFDWFDTEKEVS